MDMMEYIKENFTPTVTEDKDGMKVILTNGSEVVPDCIVWFEPAKRGWSKKPISGNQYIIVDAYLLPLFEFFTKYIGVSEDDYQDLRLNVIHYTMDIMTNISMGKNKSPFVWWCNIYSLSLF